MATSANTVFDAGENLNVAHQQFAAPSPQPTQLEIEAFIALIAAIGQRLLTASSREAA